MEMMAWPKPAPATGGQRGGNKHIALYNLRGNLLPRSVIKALRKPKAFSSARVREPLDGRHFF